jgi:hypothetical protein
LIGYKLERSPVATLSGAGCAAEAVHLGNARARGRTDGANGVCETRGDGRLESPAGVDAGTDFEPDAAATDYREIWTVFLTAYARSYGRLDREAADRGAREADGIDARDGKSQFAGLLVEVTFDNAQTAQQICTEITSMFMQQNTREREQQAVSTTSFLNQQLEEAKRKLDDQDKRLAAFKRQYLGSLPDKFLAAGCKVASEYRLFDVH